jgi:hypothetical protein
MKAQNSDQTPSQISHNIHVIRKVFPGCTLTIPGIYLYTGGRGISGSAAEKLQSWGEPGPRTFALITIDYPLNIQLNVHAYSHPKRCPSHDQAPMYDGTCFSAFVGTEEERDDGQSQLLCYSNPRQRDTNKILGTAFLVLYVI